MKINPKIIHVSLTAYCLLIFILSSIPGDNFPEVDFKFSDKIVHVIVYAVLFTLFFYSLKNQHKNAKLHANSPEYALLFTAIYGITDELHQYFVPKRSCEFSDWVADVAGGLIVYSVVKYNSYRVLKLKSFIIILTTLLICGCSATEEKSESKKIHTSISEQEVWLNLMPVIGENDNIFGFLISINIDETSAKDEYDIKDLKIYFNNDTLKNKKFQSEKFKPTDETVKINIFQSDKEMYIDKNKEKPETAVFEFTIIKNGKKIKTIKTPNLKILKVY